MSLKAKLATTIAALCMVICLLTVGVWAASTAKVNVSGTVSFVASDINAVITGSTTGAKVNKTNDPIATYTGSEEEGVQNPWTVGDLSFNDKNSVIKVTITVKNTNVERDITAAFSAKLGEEALTTEEGTTETVEDSNVIAWISKTATTVVKDNQTAEFEISFKIADTNLSVDPKVAFTAVLDLSNAG